MFSIFFSASAARSSCACFSRMQRAASPRADSASARYCATYTWRELLRRLRCESSERRVSYFSRRMRDCSSSAPFSRAICSSPAEDAEKSLLMPCMRSLSTARVSSCTFRSCSSSATRAESWVRFSSRAASLLRASVKLSRSVSSSRAALARLSSSAAFFAESFSRSVFAAAIALSASPILRSFASRLPLSARREPPVIEPDVAMTSPSSVTMRKACGYFLEISFALPIVSAISVLPMRL